MTEHFHSPNDRPPTSDLAKDATILPLQADLKSIEQILELFTWPQASSSTRQFHLKRINEHARGLDELSPQVRGDLFERIGAAIVELHPEAWREGVRYLCAARDLRLAVASDKGSFDSEALSLQMIIIEVLERSAEGHEDYAVLGEHLLFGIDLVSDYIRENKESQGAKYRALSSTLRIMELMPICFQGGIDEVRGAAYMMTAWLGLPSASLDEMRCDRKGWISICGRIEASYMWGALARYFDTLRGNGKDREFGSQNSLICLNKQSSLIVEELNADGQILRVVAADQQGRPQEIGSLLYAELITIQLKLIEVYFGRKEYGLVDERWNALMNTADSVTQDMFGSILHRCQGIAQNFANEKNFAYAGQLTFDLARFCRQRGNDWAEEAFHSYIKASDYYQSADRPHRALEVLLEGYDFGNRALAKSNREFVGQWAQYLMALYDAFDTIESLALVDEPFSLASDDEPSGIKFHPLFENPMLILEKLTELCENRAFPYNNYYLFCAHMKLAELLDDEGMIFERDAHVADADAVLEMVTNSVPGFSDRFLGEAHARVGLLMLKQGGEKEQRAYMLLRSSVTVLENNPGAPGELRVRAILALVELDLEDESSEADCILLLRNADRILEGRYQDYQSLTLEVWEKLEELYRRQGENAYANMMLDKLTRARSDWGFD